LAVERLASKLKRKGSEANKCVTCQSADDAKNDRVHS
jgi:hypothetical protein